jgi:antitoxin CcdA
MARSTATAGVRRQTNLSLDENLTRRAREYGLNVSRIAEAALVEAIRKHEGDLWQIENAEAIRLHNERVDREGVLLARLRRF